MRIVLTGMAALLACQGRSTQYARYETNYRELLKPAPSQLHSDRPTGQQFIVARPPDNMPFSSERPEGRTKYGDCLALSGGGMRSAAFAIGVLSSLNEKSLLKQFDAISAVSGGGYALSWLYSNVWRFASSGKLSTDDALKQTLAMDTIGDRSTLVSQQERTPIMTLSANSRFVTEANLAAMHASNFLYLPIDSAYPVFFSAFGVNLIANGLFSWRWNIGLPRLMYERKIYETLLQGGSRDAIVPSMRQLQEFLREGDGRNLPAFIFNTTAWVGSTHENDLSLHDSVFSFSPTQYGSGAYGFYLYPDTTEGAKKKYPDLMPITLAEVVATSGAAIDFNPIIHSKAGQAASSVVLANWGRYISNPAVSAQQRFVHNTLPFPLYLTYKFDHDLIGTHLYLSDGGHSENLGVFPLILRGCERITIVDSEEDANYRFEGYFLLKVALAKELLSVLKVPAIETGLNLEILKRYEKRSKWKMAIAEDLFENHTCRDRQYIEHVAHGISPVSYERILDPSSLERWRRFAQQPVMDGVIALPHGREIKVKYVKLAYKPADDSSDYWSPDKKKFFDREELGHVRYHNPEIFEPECSRRSDDNVKDYYYCIKQERIGKTLFLGGPSHPFPQQNTKSQNFSSEQFEAYAVLGRRIGLKVAESPWSDRVVAPPGPVESKSLDSTDPAVPGNGSPPSGTVPCCEPCVHGRRVPARGDTIHADPERWPH